MQAMAELFLYCAVHAICVPHHGFASNTPRENIGSMVGLHAEKGWGNGGIGRICGATFSPPMKYRWDTPPASSSWQVIDNKRNGASGCPIQDKQSVYVDN